jgi:hypothetical protein
MRHVCIVTRLHRPAADAAAAPRLLSFQKRDCDRLFHFFESHLGRTSILPTSRAVFVHCPPLSLCPLGHPAGQSRSIAWSQHLMCGISHSLKLDFFFSSVCTLLFFFCIFAIILYSAYVLLFLITKSMSQSSQIHKMFKSIALVLKVIMTHARVKTKMKGSEED